VTAILKNALRFDAMTVKDESISWDFTTNNQRDGWKFNKAVANVICDNGWCSFETLQTGALMETAATLDITASDVNKISFKYKNGSGGTKAKLYFITDKDNKWNDDKAFDITVTANDHLGNIYEIDTAGNEKWTDVITGLRFVPSDCAGSFMIDYITLNLNK